MRKATVLFTAICFVVAFAGVGFAANTVQVNVTSEPVPPGATCDKAGGFTFTFDQGTRLEEGDQVTIDLPLGVTICKPIDIEISPEGSDFWTGALALGGNIPDPDFAVPPIAPVIDSQQVSTSGATAGVYFRLRGNQGSQRITLDVLGNPDNGILDYLEVPNVTAQQETLILKFLDQSTNDDFAVDGIWIETNDADDDYDDPALLVHNTLCISIADTYSAQTVNASIDSRQDKYTFLPSNPQIAHIGPPRIVNLDLCKNEARRIRLGEQPEQGPGSCGPFDYESGVGFCDGSDLFRVVLHRADGNPFDTVTYSVTMEILVNGQPGNNGVYWQGTGLLRAGGFTDKANACEFDDSVIVAKDWYDASGDEIEGTPASDNGECDVDGARAVRLVAEATDLGLDTGDDYVAFDMPAFIYDLGMVDEEDVVSVRITVEIPPCSTIFSDVVEIGTFGCEAIASSYSLIYPYFTAMQAQDGWWDGIVVTNLSSTAGTATMMIYEMDGDRGTYEVEIDANSIFVSFLSSILPDVVPDSGNQGTLGDTMVYIVVQTDFSADGFAMIASEAASPNGSESMGYLPRK